MSNKSDVVVYLSNGDTLTTNMFSEIASLNKRIICIEEAIQNKNPITGVYVTRLGSIRKCKALVSGDQVVCISVNVNN